MTDSQEVPQMLDQLKQMFIQKLKAKDLKIRQMEEEAVNSMLKKVQMFRRGQQKEIELNQEIVTLHQRVDDLMDEGIAYAKETKKREDEQNNVIQKLVQMINEKDQKYAKVVEENEKLKEAMKAKQEKLEKTLKELNALKMQGDTDKDMNMVQKDNKKTLNDS